MNRDVFLYDWTLSALASLPIATPVEREAHIRTLRLLADALDHSEGEDRIEALTLAIQPLEDLVNGHKSLGQPDFLRSGRLRSVDN